MSICWRGRRRSDLRRRSHLHHGQATRSSNLTKMQDATITFDCPGCEKTISFSVADIGTVQECAHCGGYVDVPGGSDSVFPGDTDYDRQVREYDSQTAENARQMEVAKRQQDETARQLVETARQLEVERELQAAHRHLNEKWSNTIEKVDAVVAKWNSLAEKMQSHIAKLEEDRSE